MLSPNICEKVLNDPHLEQDMILWKVPNRFQIATLPTKIYCNVRIVRHLENALVEIKGRGLQSEIKTWDGCFNIRPAKGMMHSYSLHAWGLAFDINAAWNRYGAVPTLNRDLVEIFLACGFDWGGYWRTPDGMHFQLKEELFK